MQAIILCGGLSTRLGDITKETPKILLEIGNRTILDIQLELLKEAGVDQVLCFLQPGRLEHTRIMDCIKLMGRHVIPHFI